MNLRRTMRMAIAVPAVLLAVIALLLAWEVRELIGHGAEVSHTEEVKGRLFEAQKLLLDQETGIRGYLLMRDPLFLAPYSYGAKSLPDVLRSLGNLVSDNPPQQRRVADLQGRYAKWFADAEAMRASVAHDAPLILPQPMREDIAARKQVMDGMRNVAEEMLAEEDRLEAIRRGRLDVWTRSLAISCAVVLLLFAVVLATLLRRWIGELDATYAAALKEATDARGVAETFADECLHQSRDFEQRYLALSREHESLRRRTEGDRA